MVVDRAQQAADAIAALSGATPAAAKRALNEHTNDDLIAALATNAGGGTQAVSCLLARDATFDIHDATNHPILWDALYDNNVAFNTLGAIPEGMGLAFAFDGTDQEITTTSEGVWALTYLLVLPADATWSGELNMGFQSVGVPISAKIQSPSISAVVALPAGATLDQNIGTIVEATTDPYPVSLGLNLTRLG